VFTYYYFYQSAKTAYNNVDRLLHRIVSNHSIDMNNEIVYMTVSGKVVSSHRIVRQPTFICEETP